MRSRRAMDACVAPLGDRSAGGRRGAGTERPRPLLERPPAAGERRGRGRAARDAREIEGRARGRLRGVPRRAELRRGALRGDDRHVPPREVRRPASTRDRRRQRRSPRVPAGPSRRSLSRGADRPPGRVALEASGVAAAARRRRRCPRRFRLRRNDRAGARPAPGGPAARRRHGRVGTGSGFRGQGAARRRALRRPRERRVPFGPADGRSPRAPEDPPAGHDRLHDGLLLRTARATGSRRASPPRHSPAWPRFLSMPRSTPFSVRASSAAAWRRSRASGGRRGRSWPRSSRDRAPSALPVPSAAPTEVHLDWRQARRWGIRDRDVPAGTIWHFREPTLWQSHRNWLIGAVAALCLQAALIAGLVVERRLRRVAEQAVEEQTFRARARLAPRGGRRADGLDRARDQPAARRDPEQRRRRGPHPRGRRGSPGRAARDPRGHPPGRRARQRGDPPAPGLARATRGREAAVRGQRRRARGGGGPGRRGPQARRRARDPSRVEARHVHGRPDPGSAGPDQPRAQRDGRRERHAGRPARRRRLRRAWRARHPDHRARPGPGNRARGSAKALRVVLHDEEEGHGPRSLDRAHPRRSARRPHLGRAQASGDGAVFHVELPGGRGGGEQRRERASPRSTSSTTTSRCGRRCCACSPRPASRRAATRRPARSFCEPLAGSPGLPASRHTPARPVRPRPAGGPPAPRRQPAGHLPDGPRGRPRRASAR